MTRIELVPVDAGNWEDVCDLSVAPDQEGFVAPNWYSIIEASFGTELFPMAILNEEGLMVGFLMYGWDSCYGGVEGDRRLEMCRLMIDEEEQGRGYGRAAVAALMKKLSDEFPETVIHTSIEPENQAALKLYRGLGFEETGETAWDEVVLALAPSRNPAIRKEGAEA